MEKSEASETSADLTAKLKKWMLTQGYPLEMRIARAARDMGLMVQQGHHYYDQEQGAHREIDVLATATGTLRTPGHSLQVRAVFETKSSAGNAKPWVILTDRGHRMHRVARISQRYVNDQAREWWEEAACRTPDIQMLDIFDADDAPGYSLIRPNLATKESRDDQAFAALMQVTKAANGVCEWLTKVGAGKSAKGHQRTSLAVVLPVIVVDSPLYQCWLDAQGELQIDEISRGTVMWKNRASLRQSPTTIIKVMRESEVRKYMQGVREAAHVLSINFDAWKHTKSRAIRSSERDS